MDWVSAGSSSINPAVGSSLAICYRSVFLPVANDMDCWTYTWERLVSDFGCPGGAYCTGITPASFGLPAASFYTNSANEDVPVPSGFVGGASSGGGASTVTFGEPFNLSSADGVLVGGAIVSLWAIAWAMRALRSALGDSTVDGED